MQPTLSTVALDGVNSAKIFSRICGASSEPEISTGAASTPSTNVPLIIQTMRGVNRSMPSPSGNAMVSFV